MTMIDSLVNLADTVRGHNGSKAGVARAASSASLHSDKGSMQWPATASAYKLLERCGSGANSVVYHALCEANSEDVAVKVVDLESLADSDEMAALAREAHAMAAYHHPHVLLLHCSFVHRQQLWLVMPYMEGGSVAHILKYAHPQGLPEPLIASIMKPVAQALDYVHRQGGVHRDVKAGNILIGGDGCVKLGDFGSAATLERVAAWGRQRGQRMTLVGTPCWMAPEVMEGVEYGASADIWSFGITLLELAHGHAPFAKFPPMKVLLMTLQKPPPQLEPHFAGRNFSRAMRELVALCLRKEPGSRPTAGELLQHSRFFAQARGKEHVRTRLLEDLPMLAERVRRIITGVGAATATADNLVALERSTSTYLQNLDQWDFDGAEQLLAAASAAAASGSTTSDSSSVGGAADAWAGSPSSAGSPGTPKAGTPVSFAGSREASSASLAASLATGGVGAGAGAGAGLVHGAGAGASADADAKPHEGNPGTRAGAGASLQQGPQPPQPPQPQAAGGSGAPWPGAPGPRAHRLTGAELESIRGQAQAAGMPVVGTPPPSVVASDAGEEEEEEEERAATTPAAAATAAAAHSPRAAAAAAGPADAAGLLAVRSLAPAGAQPPCWEAAPGGSASRGPLQRGALQPGSSRAAVPSGGRGSSQAGLVASASEPCYAAAPPMAAPGGSTASKPSSSGGRVGKTSSISKLLHKLGLIGPKQQPQQQEHGKLDRGHATAGRRLFSRHEPGGSAPISGQQQAAAGLDAGRQLAAPAPASGPAGAALAPLPLPLLHEQPAGSTPAPRPAGGRQQAAASPVAPAAQALVPAQPGPSTPRGRRPAQHSLHHRQHQHLEHPEHLEHCYDQYHYQQQPQAPLSPAGAASVASSSGVGPPPSPGASELARQVSAFRRGRFSIIEGPEEAMEAVEAAMDSGQLSPGDLMQAQQ